MENIDGDRNYRASASEIRCSMFEAAPTSPHLGQMVEERQGCINCVETEDIVALKEGGGKGFE